MGQVLARSEIWCKIGLHTLNTAYTWEGFCQAMRRATHMVHSHAVRLPLGALLTWCTMCVAQAMRSFNELPDPESGSPRKFHLGEGDAAAGLSNIAALLAQCMWESGAEAPFSACDENNYRKWPDAACTQRSDKAKYHELDDQVRGRP